jgi:hypothetical protein
VKLLKVTVLHKANEYVSRNSEYVKKKKHGNIADLYFGGKTEAIRKQKVSA